MSSSSYRLPGAVTAPSPAKAHNRHPKRWIAAGGAAAGVLAAVGIVPSLLSGGGGLPGIGAGAPNEQAPNFHPRTSAEVCDYIRDSGTLRTLMGDVVKFTIDPDKCVPGEDSQLAATFYGSHNGNNRSISIAYVPNGSNKIKVMEGEDPLNLTTDEKIDNADKAFWTKLSVNGSILDVDHRGGGGAAVAATGEGSDDPLSQAGPDGQPQLNPAARALGAKLAQITRPLIGE